MTSHRWTFYEFFAGGGMARAGLGDKWRCTFANDFDPMKASTYRANWGDSHLICADIATVSPQALPGTADLAWASFPCQDLSLAGDNAGLGDPDASIRTRSGTFWPFWALMRSLKVDGRPPRIIVLENVYGMLTSHGGRDFASICSALSGAGYIFGAVVIDARHFLPQSRQRVFFIAVQASSRVPFRLTRPTPNKQWHPTALVAAYSRLIPSDRANWLWWNLPSPAERASVFADVIEEKPIGVQWNTPGETGYLLGLMSAVNRAKVEEAKRTGKQVVGTVYRRTRPEEGGGKSQRAEVRFDDISGCLRTPGGGSSRQTVLVIEGNEVRSRLLSPREGARLMGLSDDYKLPTRYNDAYHVVGDGVCVPVVSFIAEYLLEPIADANDPFAFVIAAE